MSMTTDTQALIKQFLETTKASRSLTGFGFCVDDSDNLNLKRLVNKIIISQGVELSEEFLTELSSNEDTPLIRRLTLQRLQYIYEYDL